MGFSRSAQQLSSQVMGEMRMEFQQAMSQVVSTMQAEVQRDGLEREATIDRMVGQVLEQIQQLQEDTRRPPDFYNADLKPLREEISAEQATCMESLQTFLQSFEDRFSQDLSQVHTELTRVQTVVQEVEANTNKFQEALGIRREVPQKGGEGKQNAVRLLSLDDLVRRSDEKLGEVAKTQQDMKVHSAETAKWLQKLHDESILRNAALDEALEEHITGLFRKHSEKDAARNDKFVQHINHSIQNVNMDFKILMNELAKIQKALHVDFAQMVEDLSGTMQLESGTGNTEEATSPQLADLEQGGKPQSDSLTNCLKIRKRVRDYGCQSDSCDINEVWTQTDEWLMKEPKKSKKKSNVLQISRPNTLERGSTKSPMELWKRQAEAQGGNMFADEEQMKARMREALIKPRYNVADYYHRTGCAQAVATHNVFEQGTLIVIFLNALWLWIDTDYNSEAVLLNAHPVFQVAEHSFCAFFAFELLVRFLAFNGKSHCLRDSWFVFDSLLVLFMVAETWILTVVFAIMGPADTGALGNASILRIVRIARIVRISRMARLMRAIPELMILLKGIGAASRSVCVFFLLWLIIIYVFAVIFRNLTDDTELKGTFFGSVPETMNTLLLEGILPDNALLVNSVAHESPIFWVVMMFFVGLASVTIMYMLIGVLVDVVGVIAATEKEALTVMTVATGLRERLEHLGRDPEAPITKYEFTNLLAMPEVALIAQDIGVDVIVLVDMVDVIYDDPKVEAHGLDFPAFVDIILDMRGKNAATVKDVKGLVRVFKSMISGNMKDQLKHVKDEFAIIRNDLWELKTVIREVQDPDEDEDEIEMGGLPSNRMFHTSSAPVNKRSSGSVVLSSTNLAALVSKTRNRMESSGSAETEPAPEGSKSEVGVAFDLTDSDLGQMRRSGMMQKH